jgi:hypothetical protein
LCEACPYHYCYSLGTCRHEARREQTVKMPGYNSAHRSSGGAFALVLLALGGGVRAWLPTSTPRSAPTNSLRSIGVCFGLSATSSPPPDFTVVDDGDDDGPVAEQQTKALARPEISVAASQDVGATFQDIQQIYQDANNDATSSDDSKGASKSSSDADYSEKETPRKKAPKRPKRPSVRAGASWMDRNAEFLQVEVPVAEPPKPVKAEASREPRFPSRERRPPSGGEGAAPPNKTFREDFRGTRVFVQGLPPDASWQDVKDHFKEAGSVVFASVSIDPRTGESKCQGIVQYETSEMAQKAKKIMRDYPLNGYNLYVREDVQEGREGAELQPGVPRGPTPPSKWKCADTESADYLSEVDRRSVLSLIKARDDARRRRQYDASDAMRDDLKRKFGVHLDDRLNMWWTSLDGKHVPQVLHDANGEGRWGAPEAWRQIPTTPENDACVNPDLVHALLAQRDIARREKDFGTADALLNEARDAPDGELYLRIHDESRTWR